MVWKTTVKSGKNIVPSGAYNGSSYLNGISLSTSKFVIIASDFDLTKYCESVVIILPDSYHFEPAYKTTSGKGSNLNTDELIFLTADFSE